MVSRQCGCGKEVFRARSASVALDRRNPAARASRPEPYSHRIEEHVRMVASATAAFLRIWIKKRAL